MPSGEKDVGIPRSAIRPADVAIASLIAIAVIFIGSILVGIADPSVFDPDRETPAGTNLAAQAVVVLAFIGTALGYAARANRVGLSGAARSLGLSRFGPQVIGPILIAIGLYLLSAIALNAILSPEQEDLAENLGADRDAAAIVTVLAGLLIIAGAAIGEELFFRGLVFGGLRQRLALWHAAIISGLVFGLLHLTGGNLAVALQLSAFGVIMAWLYERTGVLWAPIILHGINNAIAFTLLVTDTI